QKPLDSFWQQPKSPNNEFYLRFREYLIEQTQLNGSFYGKSPWILKFMSDFEETEVTKTDVLQ
ncbi:MAG: capsular polysaccharide export protein, LipB/KpsS family, partial [Psychrobacter sp.]